MWLYAEYPLAGTYVADTIVCAVVLFGYFRVLVPLIFPKTNKLFNTTWKCLAVDFVTIILPLQEMVVHFSRVAFCFIIVLSSLVVLLLIFFRCRPRPGSSASTLGMMTHLKSFLDTSLDDLQLTGGDSHNHLQLSYITHFRGYVNIFTVFCILAVDFNELFPDYLRKSRTYGGHLMDTGVGCFIIANAIVSPEAKSQERRRTRLAESASSSFILFILGFLRLILVKGFGVSVNVVEYGVHWNFFFTLGIVKFVSTLICVIIPPIGRTVFATIIIVSYQYALSHMGLFLLVLNGIHQNGRRDNFVDANREGISSCIGYLTIYLIAADLGVILTKKRQTVKRLMIMTGFITLLYVGSSVALVYANELHFISRRFANLAFVLWMLSFNTMNIIAGLILEILACYIRYHNNKQFGLPADSVHSVMPLLEAINYNGLLYFVLGNNLTGIINLTLTTKGMPGLPAYIIITVYMLILSIIMTQLYQKRFSFKTLLMQYLHCCRQKRKHLQTSGAA